MLFVRHLPLTIMTLNLKQVRLHCLLKPAPVSVLRCGAALLARHQCLLDLYDCYKKDLRPGILVVQVCLVLCWETFLQTFLALNSGSAGPRLCSKLWFWFKTSKNTLLSWTFFLVNLCLNSGSSNGFGGTFGYGCKVRSKYSKYRFCIWLRTNHKPTHHKIYVSIWNL